MYEDKLNIQDDTHKSGINSWIMGETLVHSLRKESEV